MKFQRITNRERFQLAEALPLKPTGPCPTCPKKSSCLAPCDELEALLPKADDFAPFEEISTLPSFLDAINATPELEINRSSAWRWADIADSVRPQLQQAMKENLTLRQIQILNLSLEGHRQYQIAKMLGVRRVTVFWILKRARVALKAWFGGQKIHWDKATFETLVEKPGRALIFSEGDVLEIYPEDKKKDNQMPLFPEIRPDPERPVIVRHNHMARGPSPRPFSPHQSTFLSKAIPLQARFKKRSTVTSPVTALKSIAFLKTTKGKPIALEMRAQKKKVK